MALTDTASGKKLTGITGTVNETCLEVAEGMAELIVAVDENGHYSFLTADGRRLTSGATGNGLSFEKKASDYSLWTLEAAEDGWFIQNVNASYNGNAQYMEYYDGFTTYGKGASADVSIYTFLFYKSGVAESLPESG